MSQRVADALHEVGGRSNDYRNRPGLWPGRVEDEDDPRRLNRIRVRVFHIHGDKRSTPTTSLPWCEIADFGGGGFDYGSGGRVYPVGSTVWVSFEMGDDRRPVVVGGRRGSAVRDEKNPVEYLTVGGKSFNDIEQTWTPEEGNEIPKDIFGDSADADTHPTRTVWNKSFKGHTVLVEDRDGYEFLKIVDRAGQVIEMNCPVTEEANANNAQQRGNRNASNDTQLPQSVLVNQRAFIRIKDVGGQEILLDGSGGNEKVVVRSQNRQGSSKQTATFSSEKGRERIEFVDKQGTKILIDPNAPKETVIIQDYTGNKMTFNAEDGLLEFAGLSGEKHVTGLYEAQIKQDKVETVEGSERTKILGNKFLDVLNDLSASINGATSAVFSGIVQASISNTPANGAPENTALSVEISLGGALINSQINADPMKISTLAGDIELSTQAGNVLATTQAGDITIETLAGNIKSSTTAGNWEGGTQAGNVSHKTALGTAEFGSESATTDILGPLGVNLGGSLATLAIARGEAVNGALNVINTIAIADVRVCMGIPVPPVSWNGLSAALLPFTTVSPAPTSIASFFNKTQ